MKRKQWTEILNVSFRSLDSERLHGGRIWGQFWPKVSTDRAGLVPHLTRSRLLSGRGLFTVGGNSGTDSHEPCKIQKTNAEHGEKYSSDRNQPESRTGRPIGALQILDEQAWLRCLKTGGE